ncbi:Uncharacterised protein r2_g4210 [Pycnogonum litorale]
MSFLSSIPLQPFDSRWDCWRKWKRSFLLFMRSRGVVSDDTKQAILLHSAGPAVQDVYYSLTKDSDKGYEESIKLLDDYFLPKINVPFERHQFRRECQNLNESVDQFVCRLRQKAASCEFECEDSAIRDQVIDKCCSNTMRRKFLEQDNLTLDVLLKVARAFEAVDRQVKSFETVQTSHVNTVRLSNAPRKHKVGQPKGKEIICYACGRRGHISTDEFCSAKNKRCHSCSEFGHFKSQCKGKVKSTGGSKPSDSHGSQRGRNWTNLRKGKINQLESTTGDPDEYAFSVNASYIRDDGMVALEVGGVRLVNVLVDSGSNRNVIGRSTWEYLKSNGVKCACKKTERCITPYASEPVPIIGIFTADVVCVETNLECNTEFAVTKVENARPILCKETSEALGVLRVGSVPGVVRATDSDCDIKDRYQSLFSGEVGLLKDFDLELHVNTSIKPVAQPLRRIPFGLREKVDNKLDELLKAGIIEEAPAEPTEWVSPLVVVPSGNDVRICVDMRRANEAIIRERHPIPTVDELILDLNNSHVFSKLDLKMGFHQISLAKKSRKLTTFITHRGIYRYRRLMFGVNSAPEIYQKLIYDVLSKCDGVTNIADDIIVYGRDQDEHDRRLFAVLDRLQEVGLTLNPKKCKFRLHSLTFFGHQITSDGISPSEEKVSAIRDALAPKNVSEVRSLLGLIQFCARFIPDLATVSEPIQRLCRKNVNFIWGAEQQQSFDRLKACMVSSHTLAFFRTDAQTRVIADASPYALGSVLTQLQDGVWRVVSYASRSLTDVERRYSQMEKEALALVWACERFKLYLYGLKFELETDHRPLEHIFKSTSKPPARIERWVLRLQAFDMNVVYRPGKANIADCLSRLIDPTREGSQSGETYDFVRALVENTLPVAISMEEMQMASKNDEELQQLRKLIVSGTWSTMVPSDLTNYVHVKDELCVFEQLILRGTRIVVPKNLRNRVICLAHEGHQGIVKTKNRLRSKVWWPRIDKDAERFCKNCYGCQLVSDGPVPEPMARVVPPSGPWQDCAADLLGPMPTGESVLVVVDYYSRYYETIILRSTTSAKIISVLSRTFARFGIPYTLKTDNGPQFSSAEFKNYMKDHVIEHYFSTPLWPQANGEVERQNRTLMKFLRVAHAERKNWIDELPTFLMAYRSTPQASTGASPYYLMFGREMKTKLPDIRPVKSIINERIRDHDWEYKLKQKAYADDKRRAEKCTLDVGDEVLIQIPKQHKLTPRYDSQPATVTGRVGQELVIRKENGAELRRNVTAVKKLHSDGNAEFECNDAKAKSDDPDLPCRPKRSVRLPDRFKDFDMGGM